MEHTLTVRRGTYGKFAWPERKQKGIPKMGFVTIGGFGPQR